MQDAVRVIFFSVFSIGSACDDMCPMVSGSLREMSLQALLKFECPAAIVKLLFSLPPFVHFAQFSTIYSGYVWARSKCATSWCVECTL